MRVPVITKENSNYSENKVKILTPNYVSQLNKGISYRIMESQKISQIQEEDTTYVGGVKPPKTLILKR